MCEETVELTFEEFIKMSPSTLKALQAFQDAAKPEVLPLGESYPWYRLLQKANDLGLRKELLVRVEVEDDTAKQLWRWRLTTIPLKEGLETYSRVKDPK